MRMWEQQPSSSRPQPWQTGVGGAASAAHLPCQLHMRVNSPASATLGMLSSAKAADGLTYASRQSSPWNDTSRAVYCMPALDNS